MISPLKVRSRSSMGVQAKTAAPSSRLSDEAMAGKAGTNASSAGPGAAESVRRPFELRGVERLPHLLHEIRRLHGLLYARDLEGDVGDVDSLVIFEAFLLGREGDHAARAFKFHRLERLDHRVGVGRFPFFDRFGEEEEAIRGG